MQSKLNKTAILFSFFFSLFLLLQTADLTAGGWGKNDHICEHEGTIWNGVYFDMNGLNFSASIPNYSGTSLQNGIVSINGNVKEDGYVIITSFNSGFTPQKSAKEFAKMIQDANPNYLVNIVECKKLGAKYAVDMIPINSNDTAFWRFLSTNDRLIKMGSDDANANRRLYFFESIFIH
ncbi:putative secreted protein [Candidatus Protochlamydia naegleriophila]|uniref:Putative secreted protein n=1 Tax=Candidatus Protochlamydia naegleriophila TaxID=389348 RepID=A0A0U5JDQ6_9BACT|nr:hypothetical protein [Candidatus Protochlamydia naegleriophila]CUI16938.1 putative secreted protein [Candidatus Protochlamydia naegleriophila]